MPQTTVASPTTSLRRISELDGIRGIAIALVLMSHLHALIFNGMNYLLLSKAFERIMSCGWVGVDVFFVLSGYLITGILLKRESSRYFWKVFYLRRVARILPAFFVVLSLTLFFTPPVPRSIIVMYLLFIGNWTILRHSEITSLGHIWSLAIEEQFYLIWPLVVRRISNLALLNVALGVAAFSFGLRILLWALSVNSYVIYKITPTRLDGLAIGAALAVSMKLPAPRDFLRRNYKKIFCLGAALWIVGFCALKFSYFLWDSRSTLFASPAITIMTSVGIFASIESCLPPKIHSLLTKRPLVWLGKRSYGLYLIHEPIRAAATNLVNKYYRHHHAAIWLNIEITIAVLAISLILTELSWLLIEAPSMRIGSALTEEIKQRSDIVTS